MNGMKASYVITVNDKILYTLETILADGGFI